MLKNRKRLQAILVSLSASVIFMLMTSCGLTSYFLQPTKTSTKPSSMPSEPFIQSSVTSVSPTIIASKPTFLPTNAIPCDRALLIEDVPINKGVEVYPNEAVSKTWIIKNTGSCHWTREYDIVFVGGEAMEFSNKKQLSIGVVKPGQNVTVTVIFKAPTSPGLYSSEFMLRNAEGEFIDIENTNKLFVEIMVEIQPRVEFTLELEGIHICYEENQPVHTVLIKVVNTSKNPLKSAYLQLYDETIGVELNSREAVNNPFIDQLNYCEWGKHNLQPGEYKYLSIGVHYLVAIKGREWRFTATICEDENLKGECVSKDLLLTVP